MVNHKKILSILIPAAIAAVFIYLTLFSEENRVKRAVNGAADLLNKTAAEEKLILAAKANKIKRYVAGDLQVDVPAYKFQGTYRKQELPGRLLAVFTAVEHVSVSVHDLQVDILDDYRATVLFTAKITWQPRGREEYRDYLELDCQLEKIDGDWLFVGVAVVETVDTTRLPQQVIDGMIASPETASKTFPVPILFSPSPKVMVGHWPYSKKRSNLAANSVMLPPKCG